MKITKQIIQEKKQVKAELEHKEQEEVKIEVKWNNRASALPTRLLHLLLEPRGRKDKVEVEVKADVKVKEEQVKVKVEKGFTTD